MAKGLQNKMMFMLMWVLFLVGACGGGHVQEMKVEHSDGKCNIIIAAVRGRTSEFKEAIIHGLVERYKDTCTIEVMDVSKAEQLMAKSYNVLVLVDRCGWGMRFNAEVKEMVDELDKENIVLFVTAGDPDFEYSYAGIDAITSASEKEREQEVIREISAKIDELLS